MRPAIVHVVTLLSFVPSLILAQTPVHFDDITLKATVEARLGVTNLSSASNPQPPDQASCVDPNVYLSWTPGICAVMHNVYFSTDFDEVSNRMAYRGSQIAATYDPGPLALNTTYYWCIDEVNDLDPESPWRGLVWSFTTAAREGLDLAAIHREALEYFQASGVDIGQFLTDDGALSAAGVEVLNGVVREFLVSQKQLDPNEVEVWIAAHVQYLRETGALHVDGHFEVACAPAAVTYALLYSTLDYAAAQQAASPDVLGILGALADKICPDKDPNGTMAYALAVADMNLPPPDKTLAVDAVGVFLDAVAQAAQAQGINPNTFDLERGILPPMTPQQLLEVLRDALHDALTWIIGDVAGSVIEHLQRALIDVRLDPCRLCPKQCCPGSCGSTVPCDFNGDGIIDADDLAELTALWLAGL